MAATIDTLRLAKRFKDVRLSDEQAELLAEVFREREETDLSRLATKADLAALEGRLEAKIGAKIEAAKSDLVRRFAGVMIAQGLGVVVATVTLIKLLPG